MAVWAEAAACLVAVVESERALGQGSRRSDNRRRYIVVDERRVGGVRVNPEPIMFSQFPEV